MEKKKYADIALILALLSLVSPILAILTSQGIIPKIAIFGTYAVLISCGPSPNYRSLWIW